MLNNPQRWRCHTLSNQSHGVFPILVFSPRCNINMSFFFYLKPMISCSIPSDHRENVILPPYRNFIVSRLLTRFFSSLFPLYQLTPSPFNCSSEVMFSRPLIFPFGLPPADPNFPSLLLSVFLHKAQWRGRKNQASRILLHGLHGNLSGPVALLGFCSLPCRLSCIFPCLALVEELPRCIK